MIARLRRLLVVPAVGLVLVGAPAFAFDRGATPAPTTTEVPMAAALDADSGGAWSGEADVSANLVGVEWSGDPGTEFTVELRDRNGEWKAAGTVGAIDVAPDPGSADARSAARRGALPNKSEPLWVGDADGVRLVTSSQSGAGSAVSDVTLVAVTARDAHAPNGSAGAVGSYLPAGHDRWGYGLALVLSGLVLGAVAVGWTPWRSRRTAALAAIGGLLVLAACDPAPPAPTTTVSPSQPAITTHAQWGPGLGWNPSPDCAPGPTIASGVKFAVVHHTVNANSYGPNESAAIVRAIWQYHVGTLGYCDIAYNFLVDKYGQIFEGRTGGVDKAVVAAHTGGFNTGSTGAAFIGDFTAEQPPVAAWNAMVSLLAWKLSLHHVDPSKGFTATSGGAGARWPAGTVVSFPNAIVAHRDLWPTACPGDAFYPRLGELRNAVQPQIGWEGGSTATTSPVNWIPEN